MGWGRNFDFRFSIFDLGLCGEVFADGEEAGVFALAAGVGLEGDGGEAGDFGEVLFELFCEFGIALGLVGGGEGVEVGEFGPGDGDHLGGGVEFHGAGAEGDHRGGQGEVAGLEPCEVAEHFVLGVAALEDGVFQGRRGSAQRGRDGR